MRGIFRGRRGWIKSRSGGQGKDFKMSDVDVKMAKNSPSPSPAKLDRLHISVGNDAAAIAAISAPAVASISVSLSENAKKLAAEVAAAIEADRQIELRKSLTAEDRECVTPLKTVFVGKKLGQGSFKTVYQLCNDAACKSPTSTVLQVIYTATIPEREEIRKEARLLDNIQKDDELANRKLSADKRRRPIVMPIINYYECAMTQKSFIVQPAATETLLQMGQRQSNLIFGPIYKASGFDVNWSAERESVLVYTRAQLIEAFQVARDFYQRYRLTHNDLKPDNVLVSGGRILLADLGLSGSVRGTFHGERESRPGFTWFFNCPKDSLNVSAGVRQYVNQWQLELYFRWRTTLIVTKVGNTGFTRLVFFDSINQLGDPALVIPDAVRVMLDEQCHSDPTSKEKRKLNLFDQITDQGKQSKIANQRIDELKKLGVQSTVLAAVKDQRVQREGFKRQIIFQTSTPVIDSKLEPATPEEYKSILEFAKTPEFQKLSPAVRFFAGNRSETMMSREGARLAILLERDTYEYSQLPEYVRKVINDRFGTPGWNADAILLPPPEPQPQPQPQVVLSNTG